MATALEQMLRDELESEKRHSDFLLKQLKSNQAEFTTELQRISTSFEDEVKKISQSYEYMFKEELAKNRALLEKYLQSEAVEFNALQSDLKSFTKELKNL